MNALNCTAFCFHRFCYLIDINMCNKGNLRHILYAKTVWNCPLPASPTLLSTEVPPDCTFSLPLLSFPSSEILFLQLLSLACLPLSLPQTPILFRQRPKFKAWQAQHLPLRQKSTSETQHPVIHIFVTTKDGVSACLGLAFSQTLSKVHNKDSKILKKKQLGGNSRRILFAFF